MIHKSDTQGFTFVELLVVLSIIAILVAVSVSALKNFRYAASLKVATQEVYRSVVDARSNTLASQGNSVYGVRIATTSVTRFTGATYVATSTSNITYVFEYGVTATGTLAISGTNVIFARLTGKPSATGTVYIRGASVVGTSTLVIHASGLIEY